MLGERSRKKETSRESSASGSTPTLFRYESDCASFYRKDYSSECSEEGEQFVTAGNSRGLEKKFRNVRLTKELCWYGVSM